MLVHFMFFNRREQELKKLTQNFSAKTLPIPLSGVKDLFFF